MFLTADHEPNTNDSLMQTGKKKKAITALNRFPSAVETQTESINPH